MSRSIPSTPVLTATSASLSVQRTCVSTLALSPRLAIVLQSCKLCGDATGEVTSMYSTPKSSSISAMRIFCSVLKLAPTNCSPSRSVDSMMLKWPMDMSILPSPLLPQVRSLA